MHKDEINGGSSITCAGARCIITHRNSMPTTVLPEVGGRKLLPDNICGSGENSGPHGQLEADGMVQGQVGVDHVVAGDACDPADTQPHQDLPSVLDDGSFGQTLWEQIIF